MPQYPLIPDDPGNVFESFEEIAKAVSHQSGVGGPAPLAAHGPTSPQSGVVEQPFRSMFRVAPPRIMICDDGSLDEGELIYVRTGCLVIGRTKGDIVIPHDTAMSGEHAEITRQDVGGAISWVLRDLDSSNGTLVRCRAASLQAGMVLQLGAKRYRFENLTPAVAGAGAEQPTTTLVEDVASHATSVLPSLVDCGLCDTGEPLRFAIRGVNISIGRPGFGNQIELDDPCVAPIHATLHRDPTGTWQMRAKPSLNGVWVKTGIVKLANVCYFQCGEQRFRFQMTK